MNCLDYKNKIGEFSIINLDLNNFLNKMIKKKHIKMILIKEKLMNLQNVEMEFVYFKIQIMQKIVQE